MYEVMIESTAMQDLRGIFIYISDRLYAPESAQRVYRSIKRAVLSLDDMPARFPLVREEPYASLGVRFMPVENYNAFYVINEGTKTVHVIRIVYNRREWQALLTMDF